MPLRVPARRVAPSSDYRIGPQDVLEVRVLDLEAPGEVSTIEADVAAGGSVMLPFVGTVRVAGQTVAAVRKLVAVRLAARVLVDPQVTVRVKDYRSLRIGVMGAVTSPGVFFLTRNRVGVVEALSLAGGLSKEAGTRAFVLPPDGSPRRKVDLIALLLRGDPSADVVLQPGSVVQVPLAEPFFVGGYVNRAGSFPYQRPTTVLQAVALAGGLHERKASPSAVRIKRPRPGGRGVQILEVDLDEIAAGDAPDVPVYPNDSVEVGRTVAWAVYTEVVDTVRGIFGVGFSAGRF